MALLMDKVKEIVSIIRSILPRRRPIEHHEPFIDKYEAKVTLLAAIEEGVIGYNCIHRFADYIRDVTKSNHVILTSTGSSALEIALRASGIQAGDNVIVPSATFVASANAVSHIGATPHFIDGFPSIKPDKLRDYLTKNKNIKAVMAVHLFGLPADMASICKVAEEFNLKVIEDASQALGSTIDGKHCGTFGQVGVLSFNNNKIITTNGGGAVLTNDKDIADKAQRLSTTSRIPHKWHVEHDEVAWNYRMGNINAALGCSQFRRFAEILASKRALAVRYRYKLEHLVKFVEPELKSEPNYWLNTILINNRDDLLHALHTESIRARAVFTPLHKLPMYKNHPRSDENMHEVDRLFNEGVCLPSGANL